MKIIFLLLIITLTIQCSISQTIRVAILDFENVSGNIKYDGLGKAMSSMLISDIEANVSPKRLQLVERTQIQKVLKEQNFQVSGSVDKNTMVQAGKILGVSYLLIGDVYVLNDQLIINARLTNSETGDILFSRKQEGKIIDWLILKSNIAKDLAINLAQPFTSPTIPDKEINAATITTFGNAIVAKDNGELNKAENLIETIKEFNPEFKYLDDLKLELDALKKQVAQNTEDIKNINEEVKDNVIDYLKLGQKYMFENNFINAEKYFKIGLERVDKSNIVDYLRYNFELAKLYYKDSNYDQAIKYSDIGLDIYPYFKEFIYYKYYSLLRLNKLKDFDQIVKYANEIETEKTKGDSLIVSNLKKYATINEVSYDNIEKYYLAWHQYAYGNFMDLISAIRINSDREFYFNNNFEEISLNQIAISLIAEAYNNNPSRALTLLKQIDLANSSREVKQSLAWHTMLSGDFLNAQKQWDRIVINDVFQLLRLGDMYLTKMVKCRNFLANSVVSVCYVFDTKNGIIFQDSIREYHPDGTIRNFAIPDEKREVIKLIDPYWYYEDEDGLGFVTTDPIEAYVFKVNSQFPLNTIVDLIKANSLITSEMFLIEDQKMSLINLGHSYLLNGDINKAFKIYELFPNEYKFSEEYSHYSIKEVLLDDWQEFESRGLISKEKVVEITQKYSTKY